MAILSATGTARKRTIPAVVGGQVCDIVGLHGRDINKLKGIEKEFPVGIITTDAEYLLDEAQPDFVFVGSPPSFHADQIEMCLKRRIPVLTEKPLCLSAADAGRILELATKTGIAVRVAHHLRHQPGVFELQRLLGGGSLGRLRRASVQWGFQLNELAPNARWKLDPSTGGPNAFFDAGIHVIDLLVYLLPPVEKVAALSAPSRFAETRDHVSALLDCGGVVVEVNASQSTAFALNDLVLDFEGGTVRAPHAFGESAFSALEVSSGSGVDRREFPQVNPYAEEVRDFVQLLAGADSVGTTLPEARQGLHILEAIVRAYTSGTTVQIVPEEG